MMRQQPQRRRRLSYYDFFRTPLLLLVVVMPWFSTTMIHDTKASASWVVQTVSAFPVVRTRTRSTAQLLASPSSTTTDDKTYKSPPQPTTSLTTTTTTTAPELVRYLVQNQKCYSTASGAAVFGNRCAHNVIYEDCGESSSSQSLVGQKAVLDHMLQKVANRKGKGELRLDRITDGTRACGFAWTFTSGQEEGLRGTTFIELNDQGEIAFVREIPEPIIKPGDSMVSLLYAIAKDTQRAPVPYKKQTPTAANEIGKYLFTQVQWSDINECKRFFDDDIFCRDFNYADAISGKESVAKFAEAFAYIPGIQFHGQRFDDGVLSTCYVWEVELQGSPNPIKGISFQELNPSNHKLAYMRDLSASTVFPPLLGKLARWLRPGLGVFQGVQLGSRPGGK